MKNVHNSVGYARISALRAAAEIHRHKAEYEVTVGWVANRRYGQAEPRKPTMEELADEISKEDLEAVILINADSIRQRRMKAAAAKEFPALPQPATAA
jgi:hypothetical protein